MTNKPFIIKETFIVLQGLKTDAPIGFTEALRDFYRGRNHRFSDNGDDEHIYRISELSDNIILIEKFKDFIVEINAVADKIGAICVQFTNY